MLYGFLGEADLAFACLEEAYGVIASPPFARQRATPNGLPAIRPAPPRNAGKVEFKEWLPSLDTFRTFARFQPDQCWSPMLVHGEHPGWTRLDQQSWTRFALM